MTHRVQYLMTPDVGVLWVGWRDFSGAVKTEVFLNLDY